MDFDYDNNLLPSQPSIVDSIGSINITTWIIIIMLMTFLGFNVFVYLAEGTQNITELLASVIKKVFGVTIAVTGNTIDMTAEGAKTVVDTTAKTIDAGLTAIQDITPNSSTMKGASSTQPVAPDIMQQSGLNKALNNATSNSASSSSSSFFPSSDYEAEESHSSLKSGWCYIGEDRGYRTCAQVGQNDMCMSGDIFPTHEVCINPKLRA